MAPLRFVEDDFLQLSDNSTVATWMHPGAAWETAVCGEHEMRRGRHYATFALRSPSGVGRGGGRPWWGSAMVGVVGPDFNPAYARTLPHGSVPAHHSPQGW